jgi:hypothetical protein
MSNSVSSIYNVATIALPAKGKASEVASVRSGIT